MKKFTLLTLLAFQFFQIAGNKLFNANNCYSQWVWMGNGIENKSVVCFVSKENFIFAGTDLGGIFYSTNNGQNWIQTGLSNLGIESLTTNGIYIFAGTHGSGVFRSTNYGQNWSSVGLNAFVHSLSVYNNNILAGTTGWNLDSGGVWKSSNNGQNWLLIGLNNKSVRALTISGNTIVAGTSNYGVYISTNNGQDWTQTNLNSINVRALSSNANYVCAGTSAGVWLSTNYGQSWNQIGLSNKSIESIIINGNNIFAGIQLSGVYLSTNYGQSWIEKNQGFGSELGIRSLFIANNFIFAGTNYTVWRRSLSEIIGIKNISTEIPKSFSLEQNYPNPFNSTTNIKFSLPKTENVKLTLVDLLGREISTLVNEGLQAGTYSVDFDASNLTSGVYFYRIITGEFSDIKKMILVK